MKGLAGMFLGLGVLGAVAATPDVPLELARPAREECLRGVDLALPGLPANPAALAFAEAWELHSTFSSLFGLVQVWGVSLRGGGFSATAALLDGGSIGPDLRYRLWAGQLGGGLRWGPMGLGLQAKILHPHEPKPGWGGALDLGLFWAGPPFVAALAKSVLNASPYPGETWPPDLSLAVAWPLPGLPVRVGAGGLDLLTRPSWVLAGEVELGPVALRARLGGTGLSLGGGVKRPGFAVDWVFTLHPDLPLSFRVSFGLRWP